MASSKKALFNWSGGKDSALALHRILRDKQYDITGLLTTFNSTNSRVSMHGIHQDLIEEQARQIGLPLHPVMLPENISMEHYNELMQETLKAHKNSGVESCVFGDILLEDLKAYREQQLRKVQLQATFPLWQKSTEGLAREFIEAGFKAVVVSVNGNCLDRSFAGREYDHTFLANLPDEVDPCGENGEFHTFVYDGPVFEKSVAFSRKEVVTRTYLPQDENERYSPGNSNTDHRYSTYFFLNLEKIWHK